MIFNLQLVTIKYFHSDTEELRETVDLRGRSKPKLNRAITPLNANKLKV